MTPRTRCATVISIIICMALPAWGNQFLLYSPQPAPSGQKAPSQDGILVQEIEIKRGDTLYDLSRKFSGRGMYFPQILLFNSIKNPNLIYPGHTLRVPVTKKEAPEPERTDAKSTGTSRKPKSSGGKTTLPVTEAHPPVPQAVGPSPVSSSNTELSLTDLKTVGTGKSSERRHKRKGAVPTKKKQASESPVEPRPSSPRPVTHKSAAAAAPAAKNDSGQKLFEAAVKAYRLDDCRTALDLLDRYLADNSGSPLAADANLYKAECFLKLSAQ